MKHRIKSNPDNSLDIDITLEDGKKSSVLNGLQQCQSGNCDCPSGEYDKIEKIELDASGDNIKVHLKAKSGEAIDTDQVERCLDWMKEQGDQK